MSSLPDLFAASQELCHGICAFLRLPSLIRLAMTTKSMQTCHPAWLWELWELRGEVHRLRRIVLEAGRALRDLRGFPIFRESGRICNMLTLDD